MRLDAETAAIIRDTAAEIFGAQVRLFGSRLDDEARGGDIDLYVETQLSAEEAEAVALHAACFAAGLGPGEELLTSTLTFLASANCGVYVGARPRLADIDEDTFNLSVSTLAPHVNDRTRVIMPVHFGGHPAPLDSIRELVDHHRRARGTSGRPLVLVEDGCHALGATFVGKSIGSCTHSDMTVFSFHPVKHITCAEGGAVLTNDDRFRDRLRVFRNHGMIKDPALLRERNPGGWYYEMQELGHNGRLTDLQAALGFSQLRKLDRFVAWRIEIAELYREALSGIEALRLGPVDQPGQGLQSVYHIFPVVFRKEWCPVTKKTVYDAFRAENIGVQVHYIPVHLQPYYQDNFGYRPGDFPQAETYYEGAFSLPVFPSMSDDDVGDVITAVKKIVRRYCRPSRGGG